MIKAVRVFLAAALLCGAVVSTAEATVVRVGATTAAIAFATRGSAVAYDPVNHVYLVVSTFGVLNGRFVDKNGAPVGAGHFVIQGSPNYTHLPSVIFSRDLDGGAGGFLVAWHESDLPNAVSIHTRVVSFSKGGAIGADNQVSVDGSYWERYIGMAYSTKAKEFLLTYPRAIRGIRAVRVGLSGAALAPPFTIAASGEFEEWTSAAYSPTNDQYIVVYEGFNDPAKVGLVYARAVQAGTDALLGATPTVLFAGGADFINEIVYNPDTNQFLAVWYRDAGGASKTALGRIVNPDLSLPGGIIPISGTCRAYDGLGLAFNTLTQTSFMVSHPNAGFEDCGVEIDSNGNPMGTPIDVTLSLDGKPNFYPRIATASPDDPNWLVSTSHNFQNTASQLVAGTAVTPPTPTPNPAMWLDGPGAGIVTQPFDVEGWAIDLGAPTGTGADAIHVLAWPVGGGAPIFVGATTPSIARTDIGAVFGTRFTNSGYRVNVTSLPGGSYLLAVYMRSTVTGTFNAVRTVTIAVSTPLLAIDTPTPNANVASASFFIGGWAVDLASTSGSGVNTIHIWAFPVGGGGPMFVGVPTLGIPRPDLGAILGAQFSNAGWQLTVTGMPPGTYDLAIFSQSAVAGFFNAVRVVRVVVQ